MNQAQKLFLSNRDGSKKVIVVLPSDTLWTVAVVLEQGK